MELIAIQSPVATEQLGRRIQSQASIHVHIEEVAGHLMHQRTSGHCPQPEVESPRPILQSASLPVTTTQSRSHIRHSDERPHREGSELPDQGTTERAFEESARRVHVMLAELEPKHSLMNITQEVGVGQGVETFSLVRPLYDVSGHVSVEPLRLLEAAHEDMQDLIPEALLPHQTAIQNLIEVRAGI